MPAGRPPKPTEVKRRLGNPGKRALPATVTVLPMARGIPKPPTDLGPEGRRLWKRAWGSAITWLSPDSDSTQLEETCRTADDLKVARYRYRATSDPKDARAVVALSKQLTEGLAALAFTPTARTRMGVAEVKAVDKIDQILNRRAGN